MGMLQFVCEQVRTTKKEEPKGDRPQRGSMSELSTKVDADPDWSPGKTSGAKARARTCLQGREEECNHPGREEAQARRYRHRPPRYMCSGSFGRPEPRDGGVSGQEVGL